jgi:hypothetical protein
MRLNAADVDYGHRQVDLMLSQRPGMASIVKPGDVVYEWSANRFAGRSCGCRIAWRPDKPGGEFLADNAYPTENRSGEIRIASTHPDGSLLSPQELWCCAVFELFNISNGAAWLKLEELAKEGRINRTTFVVESAKLEWIAASKAWRFYELIWVPFARKSRFEPDDKVWRRFRAPSFELWMASWRKEGYPYSFYGPYYDSLLPNGRLAPSN